MRALLLAIPLLLANADDPEIPAPVRTMLEAAMASGSDSEMATVVKYARLAAPEAAAEINHITEEWRNRRYQAAQRRLREAEFLDLVKGRAELGAYLTQGNSRNAGITVAAEVRREGIEWRHKLKLQGDYQESLGIVTRERYLAAYEPNWKFDDRAYLYGAAQYERDYLSGFTDRVSLSTGGGYSAIRRSNMKLDLELGPAFRHTEFTDGDIESNLAARGSVDFDWKLNRSLSFRQTASAYLQMQDANSTVSTKSALLARLIGPLSAQFSYTLQYESMPAANRKSTDTTSRAALVVDF
jgi:putative salt-induced outer membrane protein